jgi:hypothetical protein
MAPDAHLLEIRRHLLERRPQIRVTIPAGINEMGQRRGDDTRWRQVRVLILF